MRKQYKQLSTLLILVFLLALLLGAISFITRPKIAEKTVLAKIEDKNIQQVKEINIKNTHGSYKVWQQGGGFAIEDLPMDYVNPDYLLMLLKESSQIEYLSVVEENPKDLSIFGLDKPEAVVDIKYTDDTGISLSVGKKEPISNDRYVMASGSDKVYLISNSRIIRFIMPITNYLDFIIVPFSQTTSPLYAVGDITFTGKALPEPIIIKAVTAENEEVLKQAASFGAATHLVEKPGLHELDQKQGIELFSSVIGLLNEKVLAYNCTDEQLAEFGFDDPYLYIEFEFRESDNAPLEHITLKVAEHNGGYIVTRDDQRIVHTIAQEEFLSIDYSKIAMRWFITPFITDISSVDVSFNDEEHEFAIAGDTNKTLTATSSGKPLDIQLFRKYYTLLTSAYNDGSGLAKDIPQELGKPIMTIEYIYKDQTKPADKIVLYSASTRRLYVEVNGKIEFTMNEAYIKAVVEATQKLHNNESFNAEW